MAAKFRFLLASLVCAGLFFAPSSFAAIGWWTKDNKCTSTSGPANACYGEYATSRTFVGDFGYQVTATAWANTEVGAANNRLAPADVAQYGGGLGVRNADYIYRSQSGETGWPEHSMDNKGRFDMILFEFEDSNGVNVDISLDQVTIGWWYNDSDISVLAYNGMGAPDLNSVLLDEPNNQEGLTGSGGWEIVGNYDVDYIDPSTGSSQTAAINPTQISSSYWLIGAYNPLFGTAGCSNKCGTGALDYLKIADLVGSLATPPPPAGVPEPGSLLLLASALFITPGLRRRRGRKITAKQSA